MIQEFYIRIIQKHQEVYEPFLDDNDAIADFSAAINNGAWFKFKTKIAGKTKLK